MSGVLQESFIQSVPSNRYYRTNFESNVDYCSWFDEKREFSETRSKLNSYEKIRNVADKLMNALCHVAFTLEGKKCNEQCHNLYYWLGNKLLLNKLGENSFSVVIGILQDVSNIIREPGKCKCDFFKNINTKDFEKMKIVHDYCKDHEEIKNTLELNKKACDSKFNEYLVKATGEYEKIYECTQGNAESYCKELKKHVPSCFEKKLSHLNCEIKQVPAENLGTSHYNTTILDPEYVINVSAFSSSQIFLFFVLPFIGIFFIGFVLYKFTPIVLWIHTKVLKKKSIRRNLDEMDILELTEYTNEQRKSNLGRKQLNVAFMPHE
ncbi:PIR protein [Plasmodium malariae]|uniref:PIR protein n=1 Tax=Plasmodium malariae TaxID=5858 RepID=A0A1D3PAD5_PLAMA|nr:PIR protein [Plasmodium malariae]SCN12007.1 PIR protein [Plasmodium malariae]